MAGLWWPLDVRKECGLGSGTIHGVCVHPLSLGFTLTSSFRLAMRRVLHLRMVTQCALLEDFGIFLVLADKVGKITLGCSRRADNHPRFSLPTTLKHLCPRPL